MSSRGLYKQTTLARDRLVIGQLSNQRNVSRDLSARLGHAPIALFHRFPRRRAARAVYCLQGFRDREHVMPEVEE